MSPTLHAQPSLGRREFLLAAGAGIAVALASEAGTALPTATARKLPRWRGFNLLERFIAEGKGPFQERDFAWTSQWGFDFVRLPMDYRCWAPQNDWLNFDEAELREIDGAVAYGETHGVHVSLNFHRAPGYSVNPSPPEPVSLWDNEEAQAAFCAHWAMFAKRYHGIPNDRLSFNLVNEPARISEDRYVAVAKRAIESIRAIDEERLIISDGMLWARDPVQGLMDAGAAQSMHAYDPMRLTHYKATWVDGADEYPEPTWPLTFNDTTWNKARLKKSVVDPWTEVERRGVGVHVGEWGAHNQVPHAVALAWMGDLLSLWDEVGRGWALWNLRGAFGVVDSGRADVAYESFEGHELDRAMLTLLQG